MSNCLRSYYLAHLVHTDFDWEYFTLPMRVSYNPFDWPIIFLNHTFQSELKLFVDSIYHN